MGESGAMVYVFAHGSLLCPESLASTLPDVDLDGCVPARCHGYRRTFGVAFPNDGSQADKAFFAPDGGRPGYVVFADLVPAPGRTVNGVCVPVDDAALGALARRERRYTTREITDGIAPYPGCDLPAGTVVAFVGREEFTRDEDVERGVVPRRYVDTILRGASYWASVCDGFEEDLRASTDLPPPARIMDLTRVDHR